MVYLQVGILKLSDFLCLVIRRREKKGKRGEKGKRWKKGKRKKKGKREKKGGEEHFPFG